MIAVHVRRVAPLTSCGRSDALRRLVAGASTRANFRRKWKSNEIALDFPQYAWRFDAVSRVVASVGKPRLAIALAIAPHRLLRGMLIAQPQIEQRGYCDRYP